MFVPETQGFRGRIRNTPPKGGGKNMKKIEISRKEAAPVLETPQEIPRG